IRFKPFPTSPLPNNLTRQQRRAFYSQPQICQPQKQGFFLFFIDPPNANNAVIEGFDAYSISNRW
ncbi:MAG: hypothetical protein M0Q95_14935, partial [Porticoccaceae bacterium]|nr:hypothetical protein [Porticoccaceae bacterium]